MIDYNVEKMNRDIVDANVRLVDENRMLKERITKLENIIRKLRGEKE
jgi:hypothetical protein